jgi:prevent-host-death family protein
MREANASEVKNHFGEYLDLVRDEAVRIQRSGKPAAIMISPEEYEHFQALEDAYWVARALAAEEDGEWIGHEEAIRILTAGFKRSE